MEAREKCIVESIVKKMQFVLEYIHAKATYRTALAQGNPSQGGHIPHQIELCTREGYEMPWDDSKDLWEKLIVMMIVMTKKMMKL